MPQSTSTFVFVHLNDRVGPIDRGERYEDPLDGFLNARGLGSVTGAGTSLTADNEIEYAGLDVDVRDPATAVPLLVAALERLGAPKGSRLEIHDGDGEPRQVPFGVTEGIGVYLNGTTLPDEVYRDCDVNHVFDELNRLAGDAGAVTSHWQGPTETALYVYGRSADELQRRIQPLLDSYPLCAGARVVRIA